jgi:CHAD domain-containing protein
MSMRDFATTQTVAALRTAVEACRVAAQSPGAEPVHKMRVSIRRLQQALRLFAQYYRKRGLKRVRKELKAIMEPAGELRNYDIAIPLVRRLDSSVPSFAERRLAAKQKLVDTLVHVVQPDLFERWRDSLGITADE